MLALTSEGNGKYGSEDMFDFWYDKTIYNLRCDPEGRLFNLLVLPKSCKLASIYIHAALLFISFLCTRSTKRSEEQAGGASDVTCLELKHTGAKEILRSSRCSPTRTFPWPRDLALVLVHATRPAVQVLDSILGGSDLSPRCCVSDVGCRMPRAGYMRELVDPSTRGPHSLVLY